MTYFKKFPIIEYNGYFCRNLSTRVRIDASSVNYLPYQLKDEDKRPDIIAKQYYDDFNYDWLVLMSNNVLDPYYDLGLSQVNFERFIEKKYGSYTSSLENTVYWMNNWRADDTVLSTAAYDSLPAAHKVYYNEKLDYRGNVSGYDRKRQDWKVSTNQVVSLEVTAHTFNVKDKIKQGSTEGVIVAANTTHLTLNHILGTWAANTAISNSSVTVVTATVVARPIPSGHEMFWTPVTAYAAELQENDSKRNIKLIDNRYASRIDKQIEDILA